MKRLIFLVLFPTLLSIMLFSCSEKEPSLSADDISKKIESAVELDEGYHSVNEKYFDYYFKYNGDSIRSDTNEFVIRVSNSQSSENEFGVIKATSGKAQSVENACREYLDERKNAYLDAKASYSPDEYEKYANAKVIRVGNTVIYFILSESDAKKAESAISDLIK